MKSEEKLERSYKDPLPSPTEYYVKKSQLDREKIAS